MSENKNLPSIIKRKLPTLKNLVGNLESYDKQDKFNFLMNQQPPEKWIAKHPYIKKEVIINGKKTKVPYEYLPIDKTEYLLRKIFKKYRIEILREGSSFNGVYVVVRVHYKDVITDEWEYHDGIGAIHLQVKKGSSAADLSSINTGALSMAYPLAKTLAIKDACDMFGKLFGSDLNRRDTLGASMDASKLTDVEKIIYIKELLSIEGLVLKEEDRMNADRILETEETTSYDKLIKFLLTKKPK